jgi:hypothetical protein
MSSNSFGLVVVVVDDKSRVIPGDEFVVVIGE